MSFKTCHFCGKEFVPQKKNRWTNFCSEACLMNSWVQFRRIAHGVKYPYVNSVVEMPPKNQYRTEQIAKRREKVKELYENGINIADIAREVGAAWNTVYSDIRFLGLREEK